MKVTTAHTRLGGLGTVPAAAIRHSSGRRKKVTAMVLVLGSIGWGVSKHSIKAIFLIATTSKRLGRGVEG